MCANKYSEQENNIMRTAFLTAFPKIFTDIEYSSEIFAQMKNLVTKHGFAFKANQSNHY